MSASSRRNNNASTTGRTAATTGSTISDQEAEEALLQQIASQNKQKQERHTSSSGKRPPDHHRYGQDRYRDRKRERYEDEPPYHQQHYTRHSYHDGRQNYRENHTSSHHRGSRRRDEEAYEKDRDYDRDRQPSSRKKARDRLSSHSYDNNQSGKTDQEATSPQEETERANFRVSGWLNQSHASVSKGDAGCELQGDSGPSKPFVLKYREPPEARAPTVEWRLYCFPPKHEGNGSSTTIFVYNQSAYVFGNHPETDIQLQGKNTKEQHAILQFRALPHPKHTHKLHCQPYLLDLPSNQGGNTFLNGVPIDSARYYQLRHGDVLQFGSLDASEYVLMKP